MVHVTSTWHPVKYFQRWRLRFHAVRFCGWTKFGVVTTQLNTNSHYPILRVSFPNGFNMYTPPLHDSTTITIILVILVSNAFLTRVSVYCYYDLWSRSRAENTTSWLPIMVIGYDFPRKKRTSRHYGIAH